MLVTLRVFSGNKRNVYKQGYPINLDDTELTVTLAKFFDTKISGYPFLKGFSNRLSKIDHF